MRRILSPKIALMGFFCLSLCLLADIPVFAGPQAVEYLCEFGISLYNEGKYDDALAEFKKVILLDPNNQTAQKYINNIFLKENLPVPVQQVELPQQLVPPQQVTRQEEIDKALAKLDTAALPKKAGKEKAIDQELKVAGVKVSGSAQMSLGITPQDVLWKQANYNLNEEDPRILSGDALNRKTNTYDTRIYDRLLVNLDTENQEGLNFHSNITIDPWSFTGKSPHFTVSNPLGTDTADLELKYWSNTGYVINEIILTNMLGNSFALPEIKVKRGRTDPLSVNGAFWPPDTFSIPSQKIIRQFQPMRELWFDYKQEGTKLRLFPIAYQNQALTFDDPLVLSNNHSFWQESPWLYEWQPGHYNSGVADYAKGRYSDTLSHFTRDSDGTFLTALRGMSFEFAPDNLYFASTLASPKGLWQDYESFDNVISATRFKYRLLDNVSLGSLFTYRMGLNENKREDAVNYVYATDIGIAPIEGTKATLEVANSYSNQDLDSSDYKSKSRGLAYHFSLFGTFPRKNIMDLKYGYGEITPEKTDTYFIKYKFYLARMDEGFNTAISNYRSTRDDAYWSRHIHFREPFKFYSSGGLYESSLGWNDVEPYRIGNGIDIGRDVLGLRIETSLFEQKLNNLFDVRNVHETNGKFVENVVRDELAYKVTDKLTTKVLGIYQRLPKTHANLDPFIVDDRIDHPVINNSILDDQDPTLKTGSLGAEYAFTEWIALSGIWEHTNDYTLAYDNFVRGNLATASLATYTEYGRTYRREDVSVYRQDLFPLPPYPFYDIWKAGLKLQPRDNLAIYLDYTRNEFKSAGYIDDNINHVGFELSYLPTQKLGFFFRYSYSRWNDINRMLSGYDKIYLGHHNFFTEFRYRPHLDEEFILQYGESGISPLATISYDPFGGGLATLDTRHIVRMYYRRKF